MGVLDDLDVRASDLLQSNCVIWVEGPSDRIYFNRWIELWSNGELREGTHYQVVFYGGRLLKHLDATSPRSDAEAVQILRVNRNAAVLIDSDKKHEGAEINNTKKRILSEIETSTGLGWVTSGREIEHYIPPATIQEKYSLACPPRIDPYREYEEFLDELKPGEGDWFKKNKPVFAELIAPLLTRETLANHMDLTTRLDALCLAIRKWNGQK